MSRIDCVDWQQGKIGIGTTVRRCPRGLWSSVSHICRHEIAQRPDIWGPSDQPFAQEVYQWLEVLLTGGSRYPSGLILWKHRLASCYKWQDVTYVTVQRYAPKGMGGVRTYCTRAPGPLCQTPSIDPGV